jgi:alpha-amylase
MNRKQIRSVAVLCSVVAQALLVPAALAGPMDGNTSEVMLQGFHWRSYETYQWWDVINGRAAAIKSGGYSMVWLPPSGDSAAAEGYLPRELYKQDSRYGTQARLQAAIGALRTQGVKVIADIVINHRVGTTNWADFTNPAWGCWAVTSGDEWTGKCGGADTGDGYSAARDIDHTNGTVQSNLKSWMGWLKGTIGYDGWRYDYVKGYGAYYTGQYNRATLPYFSVGELWTDLDLNNYNPHRQQIMNWINATDNDGNSSTWTDRSAAFDFTTKGLLQDAVGRNDYGRLRDGNGAPSGAIGWWGAKSVTFLDNHDTGPSSPSGGQNHWPFPSDNDKLMQGYAYILTHPGLPSVYWVHHFDWGYGTRITQLINVRKNKGIRADSGVRIAAAQYGLYAAFIKNGTGAEVVAMKLGSNSWSPGTGWTLAASGTNWAVWTK